MQTLAAVTLISSGEAILLCVRERRHLWNSRPSTWMIMASMTDLVITSVLALRGIEMQALSGAVLVCSLAAATLLGFLADFIKVPMFRWLGIG